MDIAKDSFLVSLQGLPTFSIYSHSYLGLGAWQAQQQYMDWLVTEYGTVGTTDQGVQRVVADPCFVNGYSEIRRAGAWRAVRFEGTGQYSACKANILKSLIITDADCPTPPCSFGVNDTTYALLVN